MFKPLPGDQLYVYRNNIAKCQTEDDCRILSAQIELDFLQIFQLVIVVCFKIVVLQKDVKLLQIVLKQLLFKIHELEKNY